MKRLLRGFASKLLITVATTIGFLLLINRAISLLYKFCIIFVYGRRNSLGDWTRAPCMTWRMLSDEHRVVWVTVANWISAAQAFRQSPSRWLIRMTGTASRSTEPIINSSIEVERPLPWSSLIAHPPAVVLGIVRTERSRTLREWISQSTRPGSIGYDSEARRVFDQDRRRYHDHDFMTCNSQIVEGPPVRQTIKYPQCDDDPLDSIGSRYISTKISPPWRNWYGPFSSSRISRYPIVVYFAKWKKSILYNQRKCLFHNSKRRKCLFYDNKKSDDFSESFCSQLSRK